MSKERLIIKNFFTLKEVDIELGKYNVFIGEQASGKSLIIKLLHFFRTVLRLPINSYTNSEQDIIGYVLNYFKQIFRLEGLNYNFNSNLEYQHTKDIKIFISLHNETIDINISDKLRDIYEKSRKQLTYIQQQMITSNTHPDNLQLSIMQANISKVLIDSNLGDNKISLFFPAGRTFLVSLQRNLFNTISVMNADSKFPSIDTLILWFGQQYQNAIDTFNIHANSDSLNENQRSLAVNFDNISLKILKGHFINDGLGGFINQASGLVRPWQSSSGQQEFLPIYLVLRNYILTYKFGDLLVEEPEAHLFPSAQKALTELLIYVTNVTNGNSLNITTHSPYILTVLNNLILANDVKDKQTIFDKDLLVPFEEIRAYNIIDGVAQDLRDTESRLITAENLDKVSEQTALDFDKLLGLKYE